MFSQFITGTDCCSGTAGPVHSAVGNNCIGTLHAMPQDTITNKPQHDPVEDLRPDNLVWKFSATVP